MHESVLAILRRFVLILLFPVREQKMPNREPLVCKRGKVNLLRQREQRQEAKKGALATAVGADQKGVAADFQGWDILEEVESVYADREPVGVAMIGCWCW